KLCRRNRVSGVRFNQGVQYLAIVEVRDLERLKGYLHSLAQNGLRSSARPPTGVGARPAATRSFSWRR
ncbi:MAG: hypothetical protein NZM28_02105, partial [Fimbriimonadales bacterium]|nr:hypothetical protein [Fimbriimonadales bacterium]